MLFDLRNDPDELRDLGRVADYAHVRSEMYELLQTWALRMSQRVTLSDADIEAKRAKGSGTGVVLGVFDEDEAPADLTARYRGKIPPRH